MVSSHPLPLLSNHLILVTILCLFTLAIQAPDNKLVDDVCKQTSSYAFCVKSLYSDTRTPDADEYTLAFISVRLAYANASNTQAHINELLKRNQAPDYKQRLQRCSQDYKKAVSALATAYNDLNSETFFELADLAGDAAHAADDCQAAFKGFRSPAPLASRNHDLHGLCEICAVVGKMFTGGS